MMCLGYSCYATSDPLASAPDMELLLFLGDAVEVDGEWLDAMELAEPASPPQPDTVPSAGLTPTEHSTARTGTADQQPAQTQEDRQHE